MSTANAQTFIASFGVQHNWAVPHRVSHYINDHYYEYNWVHTRKVEYHGRVNFEIILQRGNIFIEVTLDPFGNVYKTVRRDYSPLYSHECGSYCGYHSNYYNAYYLTLNRHSHYYCRVNHTHKPNKYAYGRYNTNGNNRHGNHFNKGHKNEYRKEHKTYNGKASHRGELQNGNRGSGKSGGSQDGFDRGGGRNGSGKKNKGRKTTTIASRRPQ